MKIIKNSFKDYVLVDGFGEVVDLFDTLGDAEGRIREMGKWGEYEREFDEEFDDLPPK